MPDIRVIAVVVFRHGDLVLLGRGYDAGKQRAFFRAPGGGIHFGETAVEAACREMREEFGFEIAAPRLLGTLENLFTYDGSRGHEVVFVFEAPWPGGSEIEDVVQGLESDGSPFTAHWFRLADLPPSAGELVPPGFLDLIRPTDA